MSHRNKIAFFGTSHTYGDCAEGVSTHRDQKKFVKRTWCEYFAKTLNKEFHNFGIGGSDNMVQLDSILEAFNRGKMDDVDTLILEPRLSYDTVRLPYDNIGYKAKGQTEFGSIDYTTHWHDTGRDIQIPAWPDPYPFTENLWARFNLNDLKSEQKFQHRLNADYLGSQHDKPMEDKDIRKFVELSKLYLTDSQYLDYMNFQFIKNVYILCKTAGIDFFWINWESNRFFNRFMQEDNLFFENDRHILDLCLHHDNTVRYHIKELNLPYEVECTCGHFNDYAQPYISSYLIKGYNERKNN